MLAAIAVSRSKIAREEFRNDADRLRHAVGGGANADFSFLTCVAVRLLLSDRLESGCHGPCVRASARRRRFARVRQDIVLIRGSQRRPAVLGLFGAAGRRLEDDLGVTAADPAFAQCTQGLGVIVHECDSRRELVVRRAGGDAARCCELGDHRSLGHGAVDDSRTRLVLQQCRTLSEHRYALSFQRRDLGTQIHPLIQQRCPAVVGDLRLCSMLCCDPHTLLSNKYTDEARGGREIMRTCVHRTNCARPAWQTCLAAPRAVVRRGVMAARQPLELLGPGSSPGGGA